MIVGLRNYIRNIAIFIAGWLMLATPVFAEPVFGIALGGGNAKYNNKNYSYFDYVNPDAPKGGVLNLAASGSFDSFNMFSIRGNLAGGIRSMFETLMTSSLDERSSIYGLIAETVDVASDNYSVTFNLRKDARWHNGNLITPEDVIWSYETAIKELPSMSHYLADVKEIKKTGNYSVTFYFSTDQNNELAHIIGNAVPIFPRAEWEGRDITKPYLGDLTGSGPYRIDSYEAGRNIVYKRVKNYWGRNLLVKKGLNNFDEIRYEYYRDRSVTREAVKAGKIDIFFENNSKEWSTGYDIEPVKNGDLVLNTILQKTPKGMQGYVFNFRKDIFKDIILREAISYAMDFEWTNQTLFYGLYNRSRSYFGRSDMEAKSLPSPDELKILEPLRGQIPDRVFSEEFMPPSTDNTEQGLRKNLAYALGLLQGNGYKINEDGELISPEGNKITFTIIASDSVFERVTLPFIKNLKRLGINATFQKVDVSQYVERLRGFDFDMVISSWGQSFFPGNEQAEFWGSEAAQQNGSRNLSGISSEAIDSLVDTVIAAKDRSQLVTATKALDRALQWSFLVVPHWFDNYYRAITTSKIAMPDKPTLLAPATDAWWSNKKF